MFSSAGVPMAVDATQVEGIMSLAQAEECGIAVVMLGDILGMRCETSPASLKVLLYKEEAGEGGETYGVGVDRLDSLVPVPIGALRLLPEPLLSHAGPRPFWGAIAQGKHVVLLIDLYRLKGLKPCKATAAA